MKKNWIFILFLAISCQLSAVSGQQTFSESENLRTVESESWQKSESHKVARSQSDCLSDTATLRLCDSATLRPYDFYESQIRLADSLYKNYLPQYNFEEVKAAMEFFDSVQLSAISRQRWRLFNKKTDNENKLIAESRLLTAAKAHYYHAVGLTERDDIVGACEHYFIALEIMETETENLKTSKSEKRSQSRKVARSQSDCLSDSATQIPCDPETLRPCDLNKEDYEKIRFLSLIYTRLGELFLSEDYCNLAISKCKKALKYVLLLGESKAVANTYKCLGNSYQLYDMPDSALYYYNKSLATNSELPNRLDVEKCIAQILFDKGEKDSAYIMIKNNLGMIRNLSVKHSYYATLGSMYYKDLEYDSAIFYFKKCVKSDITIIKHLSAIRLAAIHDSIGDYEKKMYYDNISLKLSEYNMNKGVERGEMQSVYNEYVKRKQERGRLENKRKMSAVIMYFISVSFLLLITITFIIYVLKRKSDKYTNELNKNNDIINQINEEIKRKESEIREYSKIIEDYNESITILKKEIDDKIQLVEKIRNDVKAKEKEIADVNEKIIDKDRIITEKEWTMSYKDGRLRSSGAKIREQERIISIQEKKLKELENTIRDGKSADMNQYLGTTICKRILAETERVQKSKLKSMNIKPLSAKDVAVLRYEANNCLNNFLERIAMKYPDMDNDDQTCICLLLLNLDTTEISSLLSKNYSTIWRRIDNMKIKLDLKQESDIRLFLSKYL